MNKEIPQEIPQEIIDEGFRWLNVNEDKTCKDKEFYGVPRVSSEYMDCSMPMTFDQYNFCVTGDTKIIVKENNKKVQKPISEVKIGELVLCYNTWHRYCKREYRPILNIMKREVNKYLEIELEGEEKLHITENHEIYVKRKNKKMWIRAGEVHPEDLFLTVAPYSKEAKINFSNGRKGRIVSKDWADKIRKGNLGKKRTMGAKIKYSISKLGKLNPNFVEKVPFTCPICGKVKYFTPNNCKDRVICSIECSWKYHSNRLKVTNPSRDPISSEKIKKTRKENGAQERFLEHLKKKPSSIELLLREELDRRRILYTTGFFIYDKKFDFFHIPDILFKDKKLSIECDGLYWHKYPNGTDRDRRIDYIMLNLGWKTLRFWENSIKENVGECANMIERELCK